MGELIVVSGPPGAGKTTVSRILAGLFEQSARIAGDEFFGFIDQGYLAPWTEAAHHQNKIVIEAAAAAAGRLAVGGYTVIFDGVVGPWLLEAFGQATGLPCLHYAILLPPERVCLDRVASRVGHGFVQDLVVFGAAASPLPQLCRPCTQRRPDRTRSTSNRVV